MEPGDADYAGGQANGLRWKGTKEAKLAILEVTETRDLVDTPRGTNPRRPIQDLHVKDDIVENVERCVVRFATKKHELQALRVMHLPCHDSRPFELSETLKWIRLTDIQAAYLTGLPTPFP